MAKPAKKAAPAVTPTFRGNVFSLSKASRTMLTMMYADKHQRAVARALFVQAEREFAANKRKRIPTD